MPSSTPLVASFRGGHIPHSTPLVLHTCSSTALNRIVQEAQKSLQCGLSMLGLRLHYAASCGHLTGRSAGGGQEQCGVWKCNGYIDVCWVT